MLQIEGILWDWGKVLGLYDHKKSCDLLAYYSEFSPEEVEKILFDGPTQRHTEGKLSPRKFYEEAVRATRLSDLSYKKFCDIWSKAIIGESPGISALFARIDPQVKMVIVSDTDPIHWSAIEKLPIMKKFFPKGTQLIRSYDLGMRKPNKRMYYAALERLRIPKKRPYRALYIDDIEENCTTFARMGGRVLLYNCTKDPLARLETTLADLGALR